MSETKDEIAAERDALRAENEQLRAQLQTAQTVPARPANPEPRFELSEGEREELQRTGVTRSVRTSQEVVASDYSDLVDESQLDERARANQEAALKRRGQ